MGWSFAPSEWPTIVTFVAAWAAIVVFTAPKIVVAVLGEKQDQGSTVLFKVIKPTYLACSSANPL